MSVRLAAQLPYTQPLYAVDTIKDVFYGVDSTFAGGIDSLFYDMYRPAGDANCLRPVAVVIHGGAWVAGTKRDPDIVYFAGELARRGWLTVSPKYRLGNHKTTSHTMYALCTPALADPCAYVFDSAEVVRANYRGMQDIKGLLRHLASRSQSDSSDMGNLFLIGESAGGFVALTTAFMDRQVEKPLSAGPLSAVSPPDPDMYTYGCLPVGANLSRPDLGSIRGRIATTVSDPVIRGVASIFGGILDSSLFIQSGSSPRVFLFHQGSDVIVHPVYARLLSRISGECFAPLNICQPIYNYPVAWGGEGVRRIFTAMGPLAPTWQAQIVANYEYGNDCFDNGHSLDDPALRFNQVLQFFAEGIDTTNNHPPNACASSGLTAPVSKDGLSIAIENGTLVLSWAGSPVHTQVVLLSIEGKAVLEKTSDERTARLDVSHLPPGIYIIQLPQAGISRKLVLRN